jgi:hypothetical protein
MGCASDNRAQDPEWWDASNFTWDTTFVWTYGWYAGLHDDPEYMELYWARWRELLAAELSVANMNAVIDSMAAELAEAAPRNYERWSGYPPRDGGFDGEIALLKEWMEERHEWISGCLDLPDPQTCTGD